MDFTNIMRIVNTSLLTSRLSTIDEEGSRLSESSDICEFKILKILHETCSNYYFFFFIMLCVVILPIIVYIIVIII